MATLNLRGALELRFGKRTSWSIRSLHNGAYAVGSKSALPLPYSGMRAFTEALPWPASYRPATKNPDSPSDASPGWTNALQGVSHDDNNWYFTQQKKIWKIPVSHSLGDELHAETRTAPIPLAGYDHFGDCDFDHETGFLYVPLEGADPPMVAMFDKELTFVGSAALSQAGGAPWCAVNPVNGLVYSSGFNSGGGPILLHVYQRSASGLALSHLGTIELLGPAGETLNVEKIQGGAISPRGHVYLISDVKSGGILGFDLVTGQQMMHQEVDYSPNPTFLQEVEVAAANMGVGVLNFFGGLFGADPIQPIRQPHNQELEGVTIWPAVGAAGAPGMDGDLHMIMLDLDTTPGNDDDLYFKHYEVDPEDRARL
jgi:hypothetical protein